MKKLTPEEFLERANKKFPTYLYDKVVYVNNKTDITVTCPIHGDFQVRPDCLLNGTGCPDCGGTKKMNTEDFIKKANYVHNNFFTYEHTIYSGSSGKIFITCPHHGDFEIRANNHLQGQACQKCKKEGITHTITKLPKAHASTKKLTNETFFERAFEKWGDEYTYEHVQYEKNNKKVLITCKEHGDFPVTPNHFLAGRGCPFCAKNRPLTNEEFIDRLKKINGDKCTYEKTVYKTTHEPVIVTCKEHGDFKNLPSNLLRGQGCPICKNYKLEMKVFEFLKGGGFNFEFQKRFKWLGKQSIDFYIDELKIAIECQGIQHFEEVSFFDSHNLEQRIQLDKRKKELCSEHGIEIIYYTDCKEHINNKDILDFTHLKQFLNDKNKEHRENR